MFTEKKQIGIKGEKMSKEKQENFCTWEFVEDDIQDYWQTSCGQMYFMDGTPYENHVKFCLWCTNRIKEKK